MCVISTIGIVFKLHINNQGLIGKEKLLSHKIKNCVFLRRIVSLQATPNNNNNNDDDNNKKNINWQFGTVS